jgi:hypothetical protein
MPSAPPLDSDRQRRQARQTPRAVCGDLRGIRVFTCPKAPPRSRIEPSHDPDAKQLLYLETLTANRLWKMGYTWGGFRATPRPSQQEDNPLQGTPDVLTFTHPALDDTPSGRGCLRHFDGVCNT